MFDRFTAPARRAMQRAFREARRCQHDFLGTEHLLFGLLCDPDTGAHALLRAAGGDPAAVLARLEADLLRGDGHVPASPEQFPVSPAAKRAIEQAAAEAAALGRALVGPEHLLLGLLHEPESVAAALLADFAVRPDELRRLARAVPPADQREHQVQTGSAPLLPPPGDVAAEELEKLVAPPVTRAAAPGADAPTAAPLDIAQPASMADYAAAVEAQLRRTQLLLGALLGFYLGHTLSGGWEVGLLGALGGMAVASVRNSGTGALMGFLAGFIMVPSFGGHLVDTRAGTLKLLLGAAGAFLGSFLGDFWRRPVPWARGRDPRDDDHHEGTA